MTVKYADRVFETTTTTGTGTINLNGAQVGYRTFVAGVGTAAPVPYAIFDNLNWEVGRGTVTAGSPDTLQRNVVLSSSNAGSAVNWGAGTRNVILPLSSTFGVWRDVNLNDVSSLGVGGGTANAQTVTMTPAPLGYSNGQIVRWIATVANTGAMTINVNGLGAKSYVDGFGAAFGSGAVALGSLQQAFYNLATDKFVSLSLINGVISVANGGTGVATLTSGQFPIGQGTSPVVMSANMAYNTGTNVVTFGTSTTAAGTIFNSGNAQFPVAMAVQPSTHATSRRATWQLDDWQAFQDTAGNGTKDFAIYKLTGNITALSIDTAGRVTLPKNVFTSANQTITSGGLLTLAHGLGVKPNMFDVFLYCATAEANYSIGDIFCANPLIGADDAALSRGQAIYSDSTNVYIRFGSSTNVYKILNKTTGNSFDITNANWRLIVRAEY
jgi:hypothetical protein